MTDERFGSTLAAWLREDADHRVPRHLEEVLLVTVATRQRPWWASLGRWLPLTTTTFTGRTPAPRALFLAMIMVVALAAVGLALFIGAQRHTHTPFGLAPNGRIFVADGGTIRSFAADGSDPREVLNLPGGTAGLALSPDATRLAYKNASTPVRVEVLSLADGSKTEITVPAGAEIADEPVSWSPDGRQLTFAVADGGGFRIDIAAADGASPPTRLAGARINADQDVWRPSFSPDGEWIAYTVTPRDALTGTLRIIRPDGSDDHAVASPVGVGGWGSASWAPDPHVERLLFPTTTDVTVLDVMTGERHAIPDAFWPSWSPDGSRIAFNTGGAYVVATADVLAGQLSPVQVFAPFARGDCQHNVVLSGRAVCSPLAWSPDGTKVIGADVAMKALVMANDDGTGAPRVLDMEVTADGVGLTWAPAP